MCVVVMMSSSLHTAPSENARRIFENTSDLRQLCINLQIPDNNATSAASATEHFLWSTEPMKVRKMVYYLDDIGDTALADTVMKCAEPPAGIHMSMSCGKGLGFCCSYKLVVTQENLNAYTVTY